MASTNAKAEHSKRTKERWAIFVLAALFVVLTIAEFRLTNASQHLPLVNSIFFFGLINVNILLLLALFWLIFRNVGKLFLERRRGIIGAKLKTKLVVAFLAFSIIPTIILFVISSSYINSSFDKWFSIRIQNTLQSSLEISNVYYQNAERVAHHFAEHLAKQLGKHSKLVRNQKELTRFLRANLSLLALHGLEFYPDPIKARVLVTSSDPVEYPRLPFDLLDQAFQNKGVSTIQHFGSGDLVRCLMPVIHKNVLVGVLVVNAYLPVSIVRRVGEISSAFEDYKGTNPLKYPIKSTYLVILIMVTLVLIFVAIWLGLYLARELTDPVESLLQGLSEVGQGNFNVHVESTGNDEISRLIESFNLMTDHLKESRVRLTKAHSELETVLTNIANGVLVVEKNSVVTAFNRTASKLLGILSVDVLHKPFGDLKTHLGSALVDLIDRALHPPYSTQTAQWNEPRGPSPIVVSAIATPILQKDGTFWGSVIVFEDISGMIRSQRELAWREVARRIAHEIKNPLTPIKLSAQRLQRKLLISPNKDHALIKECTETIVQHTDELKQMVNEFSEFARLPSSRPANNDLHAVVHEAVSLFQQAHAEIEFKFSLDPQMPKFEFDRDQIKRVLTNLVDNAVTAALQGPKPMIHVSTTIHSILSIAAIAVEDNGPGIAEPNIDRVFEPYYSTKISGTGLGLAIAKRIVNDHNGFVRVTSTPHKSTKFVVELPTADRSLFLRQSMESSFSAPIDPHH